MRVTMKLFTNILLLFSLLLYSELHAQCTTTAIANMVSCNGSCDGSATASAYGGVAPYSYIWGVAAGSQTGITATGLCTGVYSVSSTDANGCTSSFSVTIAEPAAVTFNVSQSNATCFGTTDGAATVINLTGGSPPYTYIWSNGANTASISGLASGIYIISVTDVNGCGSSQTITISDTACPRTLYGVVKRDTNSNCIADSLETPFAGQFIRITNNSTGYTGYASTNSLGQYEGRLDTGTYTLELIPPLGIYWNSCQSLQTVTIDSTNSIDTIDWVLESTFDCPLLTVNISAPFIRPTGGGSNYIVHYCNHGTVPENDPYVEVSIDSFLNVLGTSIPITSQTGDLFRFDLDTLNPGQCGSFAINVIADSNVTPGQTHCSEAHIYPDSICLPPWNGAILNTNGSCLNDTIFFQISNSGNSMLANANYTIFEDDVIIHVTSFMLNGGSSITIPQPVLPGKTYRIEAPQESGFPNVLGAPIAYTAIEGCNPFLFGGFNTGFITQYYTGNTSPFISIDCQPNRTSYDPNDKAAQPAGYGSQHYISANTPLEYKVRFQNTGTDTAFNIVIIDTLSAHVNPTTLQMGASSHPYTWSLSGTGILTVNFNNILLVDSNANEPLSHGFFNYNIEQQPNLANGTVINNQAAIYFDYNPPIFTNTTFHTIGENYIPIILKMKTIGEENASIHVYPNPTTGIIYVEKNINSSVHIHVIDNLGQVVLQQTTSKARTSIDLKSLPAGIYYIQIQNENERSVQKIIKY